MAGNMEMIAVHLCEVHYWMVIACDNCWPFASMTTQNIQDHQSECKGKCDKEHMVCDVCEAHRKESKSHKLKKYPNCRDRREHLNHSVLVSMDQLKMLPRNHAEQNATLYLALFLLSPA